MDDRQLKIDECLRRLRQLAAEISINIADMRELQLQISGETYYVTNPATHVGDPQETITRLRTIQRLSRDMLRSSDAAATAQRHLRLELAMLSSRIHQQMPPRD